MMPRKQSSGRVAPDSNSCGRMTRLKKIQRHLTVQPLADSAGDNIYMCTTFVAFCVCCLHTGEQIARLPGMLLPSGLLHVL